LARVNSGIRAQIAKIASSFGHGRYCLIEIIWDPILAPFLRPKEERVILPDWAAYGVSIVVFLLRRNAAIEVILRIESVISDKFVHVTMETIGSCLSLHFYGT
jgi:hypothetical protein